jgi:hypothetical protein
MSNYRRYENLSDNSSDLKYDSYSPYSIRKSDPDNSILPIQNAQHKHKIISDNMITCIYVFGSFCKSCVTASPKYSEFSKIYKSVMFVKEDINLGLSDCKAVPIFQIYVKGNPKYVAQVYGPNFDELKSVLDKLVSLTSK